MRRTFGVDPENETIATFLGYYTLAYRLPPESVKPTDGGPEWSQEAERAIEAELAVMAMDPTVELSEFE